MIPSFKLNDIVFSDTYAKFAADLMSDVSRELLTITTRMDWGLQDSRAGSQQYRRAQLISVDKPVLVAAAAYSQWISDHLRYEIAQWRDRDLHRAELVVSDDPDKAALCRREQAELELVQPPFEPPLFPAPLQAIHEARQLETSIATKFEEIDADLRAGRSDRVAQGLAEVDDHGYADRLDRIRETLVEAIDAMSRNKTKNTDGLRKHADALASWAGVAC